VSEGAPEPELGNGPRVAYMLGTFPALTETFVAREMSAVRQRGIEIVICATRRPRAWHRLPPRASPLDDVRCLYARPDRVLGHAVANLWYLVRRPRQYLAALRTFVRGAAGLPPGEAAQLLYHFFAGVGFCRDLASLGVTHLHCHFTSATNMALAANIVGGMPYSFTAHASDDLFMRPVLMDAKVARARFVVPVCDYSGRFLDSITGFRFSHKLHRVHNGIALSEAMLSAATAGRRSPQPAAGSNGYRIVSVGSLVSMKGHATLIQVCARLVAQGASFHCRIIGEGPERPILEHLLRLHNLQEHVELMGALGLDEVLAEMLRSDVFVLLSEIGPNGYRDGFPTVILEAMAAGLPVVATSLSGIPEMVENQVTGFLVPERDPEAATRALTCLLESADLRRSMGVAGRARVRERFDLGRSADQLVRLLRTEWGST
jgi:glycosyltransferase involved in cell wall biosynthesis